MPRGKKFTGPLIEPTKFVITSIRPPCPGRMKGNFYTVTFRGLDGSGLSWKTYVDPENGNAVRWNSIIDFKKPESAKGLILTGLSIYDKTKRTINADSGFQVIS